MKGKTQVKAVYDIPHTNICKGDVGYIDGYVQGSNSKPYAVLVIPKTGVIDTAPIWSDSFELLLEKEGDKPDES